MEKVTVRMLKEGGRFDTVSKRDGTFTVRRGFFYRNGGSSEALVTRLEALVGKDRLVVLDHGEHWVPFRGGASVANSSHWWVKFRVKEEA
jgi:hypothetical protein